MEQKTCAESFQKDFSAIDNLLRVLQKGKIAKHKLDEGIIHTRISVCHRIDEFLKVTWWSQNISLVLQRGNSTREINLLYQIYLTMQYTHHNWGPENNRNHNCRDKKEAESSCRAKADFCTQQIIEIGLLRALWWTVQYSTEILDLCKIINIRPVVDCHSTSF